MVLKMIGLPPALVTPVRGVARERVDVDVARRDLAPRRADADLGLLEVFAREADGVQHGAPRRAFGAVKNERRMWALIHRARFYRSSVPQSATCPWFLNVALERWNCGTMEPMASVRLDMWLDVACLFKTRSEATKACKLNKVIVNGAAAKPHRDVEGRRRDRDPPAVRPEAAHNACSASRTSTSRRPKRGCCTRTGRRNRRRKRWKSAAWSASIAPRRRPKARPDRDLRRTLRRLKRGE